MAPTPHERKAVIATAHLPDPPPILGIGEAMVELRRSTCGWEVGMGGDVFNTLHHLARLGHAAGFATALGDDAFGSAMRNQWWTDGIDTRWALTASGRTTGLYAIGLTADGERSFTYWRDRSAARAMLALPDSGALLDAVRASPVLVLSGITLALFEPADRRRLIDAVHAARASGARVLFDPNYRPRLWQDADAAREACRAAAPAVSIVLPSLDDEQRLFGGGRDAVFRRWTDWGAGLCVVKDGARGAHVRDGGTIRTLAPPHAVRPVDTTGAGDAFNAGLLSALLAGEPVDRAVLAGHERAAIAIALPGALGIRLDLPGNAVPPAPAIG